MRRLLITDLDNTLYDWVTFFAQSFAAMVDELERSTGIERDVLLDEFRAIHRQHRNSEHPFAVLELPSVKARFAGRSDDELLQAVDGALHRFNETRRRTLSLYEGVEETLTGLTSRGIIVVGHTEAIAANAVYRLSKLHVAHLFSRVFALEAHLGPHPRGRPTDTTTIPVEEIPISERKPNPALLLDICGRYGCRPDEAVYVGDSIVRDMSMARQAGVLAAWARYGTRYDPEHWRTLVRVTHWSDDDVERERRLKEEFSAVQPDVILDSFSDLAGAIELA